jgi:hypothetical protein
MLNWCEEQDNYICKEDAMTRFFEEFSKIENEVLIEEKNKNHKLRNNYLYISLGVLSAAILYKHFR